ncbi:hypothetical protein [Mycobacterium sp. E1715]|uniref:hypothetical protein n=1 Tax=Mycobacterium sp. E1715 TaxID=1856863 RepID=UPI0018D4130B|nr:hypothetical protein [Mycobacterium sp. E1715]
MSGAADGEVASVAGGNTPPGESSPPLSCQDKPARSEAGFRTNQNRQPTPVGLLWRARTAKGKILKNVRKTLVLAAVTGTLVTIPSATATAEPTGFDPNRSQNGKYHHPAHRPAIV